MTTLLSLVETSRAFALRTAAVARLAAEFEGVEVKAWPGKLDVQDMVERTGMNPPSILVAVTGQPAFDDRLAGQHDELLDLTAYVVTEDKPLGPARKVYRGDEIGLSLCNGLLRFLATDAARWGIDEAGHPENAKGQAVLTLAGLKQGTAFFAVTWRQTVHGQGRQLPAAFEGPPPPLPTFRDDAAPPGTDLTVEVVR